jgi:hypothetical protein
LTIFHYLIIKEQKVVLSDILISDSTDIFSNYFRLSKQVDQKRLEVEEKNATLSKLESQNNFLTDRVAKLESEIKIRVEIFFQNSRDAQGQISVLKSEKEILSRQNVELSSKLEILEKSRDRQVLIVNIYN